jgi:hypothetical protein
MWALRFFYYALSVELMAKRKNPAAVALSANGRRESTTNENDS